MSQYTKNKIKVIIEHLWEMPKTLIVWTDQYGLKLSNGGDYETFKYNWRNDLLAAIEELGYEFDGHGSGHSYYRKPQKEREPDG